MKTETATLVTDKIIEAMEAGIVPWRKPWTGQHNAPTSLATGKAYRGINYLILGMVGNLEGYSTGLWGTFNQFKGKGFSVNKGEKGTHVVLYKPVEKIDDAGEKSSFAIMRSFNVFNIEQTNMDLPVDDRAPREPVPILEGVQRALDYPGGPKVRYVAGDSAHYMPSTDTITLPKIEQFHDASAFAETALHEIAHSTGHEKRLHRDLDVRGSGCTTRASEELVAEIGQAMLATELGIDVDWTNTAAYVDNWLKVLKDDRKMIISAAAKAQKIVDHVLPAAVEVAVAA